MKEGKKWNQDRSCEGMSENLKIIKVVDRKRSGKGNNLVQKIV